MSYDAPDDWNFIPWFKAMNKEVHVTVMCERGTEREDVLRKQAARALLSGIVTPAQLEAIGI